MLLLNSNAHPDLTKGWQKLESWARVAGLVTRRTLAGMPGGECTAS